MNVKSKPGTPPTATANLGVSVFLLTLLENIEVNQSNLIKQCFDRPEALISAFLSA